MTSAERLAAASCAALLCLAGGALAAPKKDAWVPYAAIFDAMEHPNCLNCHAVKQTNYTRRGDGSYGLPSDFGTGVNHPEFPPFANVADEVANCSGCHASTLAPYLPGGAVHGAVGGNILDIEWHAAPIANDFRQLPRIPASPAALCGHARDPGSVASDVVDHLSNDPMILWAIGNGPTASGDLFKSAPGPFGVGNPELDIPAWRQLVADWAAAGMPCPRAVRDAKIKRSPDLAPFPSSRDLLIADDESGNLLRVDTRGNGAVSIEISRQEIEAVLGLGPALDFDDGRTALAVARNGTIYFLLGAYEADFPPSNHLLRKARGRGLEVFIDDSDLPSQASLQSMAIGSDGNLYLLDGRLDSPDRSPRVLKLDEKTGKVSIAFDLSVVEDEGFIAPDPTFGPVLEVADLIADAGGVFWITGRGDTPVVLRVEPLAASPRDVGVAGATHSGAGVAFGGIDITRSANGNVVLLDLDHGVTRMASTGELSTILGPQIFADCANGVPFNSPNPSEVAFDGKGALYLTGSFGVVEDSVYRIDASGCNELISAAEIMALTGIDGSDLDTMVMLSN